MIINSPNQTVVVGSQKAVPEPSAPKNQEYTNSKATEIKIESIDSSNPNPLIRHNKI